MRWDSVVVFSYYDMWVEKDWWQGGYLTVGNRVSRGSRWLK